MAHSSRENGRGGGSSGERPTAYRSSNPDSKFSRSYRSPPLSSRVHPDEHRSRRDTPPLDINCLSSFYRERFGSHSPEDYLNLRISQFDKSLDKEDILEVLKREFKHLAPFEIKMVRNPEDDERLAYVNFEGRDCAKSVRRALVPRLRKVLGRCIAIDPAGVIRDQDGKYIPDRFNRIAMHGTSGRSPPPIMDPRSGRRSSPPHHRHSGRMLPMRRDGRQLNQDDKMGGRTLFVGNLPGDIRESELRRVFANFGDVEDVDIKNLSDSNAAYAFILMGTVEEAVKARQGQHDKPIRPGGNRCKLGYGKTQNSERIIVGGLGEWATAELLSKEFSRFGEVSSVDYEDRESHAHLKFAELSSAVNAVNGMKNFPLGGKDKCITVDFLRDPTTVSEQKTTRKRARSSSSEPEEADTTQNSKKRTRVSSSVSPSHSPSRAPPFNSFEELKEQVACTWKGFSLLKKTDYLLSLYRLFGREHLIQEFLRDKNGASIQLQINQRLPILPDLTDRLLDFNRNELALVLADGADKPIDPLVQYLQSKKAAGIVTLEGAILYVFPYSESFEKLIKFFAPRVVFVKPDSNFLLMALKKNQAGGDSAVTNAQTNSFVMKSEPPFSANNGSNLGPAIL